VANSEAEEESTATLPVLSEGALYPLHLGSSPQPDGPLTEGTAAEPLLPLRTFIQQQEQAHLLRALHQTNNDKEQAALLMGVSLATLYRKLAGDEAG
jgi:transcriptional regulator with PAS, ATPase and Fis domain